MKHSRSVSSVDEECGHAVHCSTMNNLAIKNESPLLVTHSTVCGSVLLPLCGPPRQQARASTLHVAVSRVSNKRQGGRLQVQARLYGLRDMDCLAMDCLSKQRNRAISKFWIFVARIGTVARASGSGTVEWARANGCR